MIINDYFLGSHFQGEGIKDFRQIVVGNVFEYSFECLKKSFVDYPNNRRFPNYVIDIHGNIYNLLGDKNYSDYLNSDISQHCISVGIINLGVLIQKPDGLADCFNNKFCGEYVESEWKGLKYWAKYSNEQIHSLGWLCNFLCDNLNIKNNVQPTNVKRGDINNWNGISYRSNHNQKYYDITPAFDIDQFIDIFKGFL